MRKMKRLLIVGVESWYLREVVTGIYRYCGLHGVWETHMEGFKGDNDPETLKRTRLAIRQWKADGIIAHIRNKDTERLVRNSGLPAVNIGSSYEMDMPTVIIDNVAAGRMAARHLLDNGLKNFGFCAKTGEGYSERRCEGFLRELSKEGFRASVFSDRLTGDNESNWVQNRQRSNQWLRSMKKPVGVLCVHELRAIEVVSACRRLRLRVPDEVAVVSVGNDPFFYRSCNPPLSTIAVDLQRIGYQAAELLDRLMCGKKAPWGPILIPPHRVAIRQSSDMIAVEDSNVAAGMRFIRDHVSEPFNVKELMRHVSISRRLLEQRFKKFIGRTPSEEIMRTRIERAKSFLEETQAPISVVAQNAGFAGREIFAACFRRETGLTPTEYRRKGRLDRDAPFGG